MAVLTSAGTVTPRCTEEVPNWEREWNSTICNNSTTVLAVGDTRCKWKCQHVNCRFIVLTFSFGRRWHVRVGTWSWVRTVVPRFCLMAFLLRWCNCWSVSFLTIWGICFQLSLLDFKRCYLSQSKAHSKMPRFNERVLQVSYRI